MLLGNVLGGFAFGFRLIRDNLAVAIQRVKRVRLDAIAAHDHRFCVEDSAVFVAIGIFVSVDEEKRGTFDAF